MKTTAQSAAGTPARSSACRAAARAAGAASISVESPTPACVAIGRNLSRPRQFLEFGIAEKDLEFFRVGDPVACGGIFGRGRPEQCEHVVLPAGRPFDPRQTEVEPAERGEVPAGLLHDAASTLPIAALDQEEKVGGSQVWVAGVGRQHLPKLDVGLGGA